MRNVWQRYKAVLWMCAPVLIMGIVAWQTSRPDSFLRRYFGPFRVYVQEVRPIAATAYDAREGRNFAWEMCLNAHGPKPAWWGQPIGGRSGFHKRHQPEEVPSRLVIIDGSTTRKLPDSFVLWTTTWDKEQQLYTARLEANGDNWPREAQVRWQGHIAIRESNNKPVSKPISFDIVLKESGKVWPKPHFSRAPQIKITGIEIGVVNAKEHEARITVFSADGGHTFITQPEFEDAQGRKLEFIDTDGSNSELSLGFGSFGPVRSATSAQRWDNTTQEARYFWHPDKLKSAPRDVFVVANTTAHKRWPLQFRFPIKRNGKILRGRVPFTTRSAPIPRD